MIDFRSVYRLELDVVPVINRLEAVGIAWDAELARAEDEKIRSKMQILLDSDAMAGVNPNSTPQVKKHFLALGMPEKLLLKKGKVTTGEKQVDSAVRRLENDESWAHVALNVRERVVLFSKALSGYRHLAKVSGTYLRPFSDMAEYTGGLVYPGLNPFGAITGRMSGTGQQMPKATDKMTPEQQIVRKCCVCKDGCANYYFDYGQMEMAVFGTLAGEDRIIDGYASGEDIHQTMADVIGLDRDLTKGINFGIVYGEGVTLLAANLGVALSKAKELRAMYFEEFPAIQDYTEELGDCLRDCGFVQDVFGRRYNLNRGEAYKAVNAVVQGTCASVFKRALIQTDAVLDEDERLFLVVHDEQQIERPESKPGEGEFVRKVVKAMQEVEELQDMGLVLNVDCKKTVTNWADKQSIKF